jgi:HSP20 family protein
VERTFGSFRRSFTLPKGVNVDDVKASTEHGQVKVFIPKPVAELPRKVKIQSSSPAGEHS